MLWHTYVLRFPAHTYIEKKEGIKWYKSRFNLTKGQNLVLNHLFEHIFIDHFQRQTFTPYRTPKLRTRNEKQNENQKNETHSTETIIYLRLCSTVYHTKIR